MGMYFNRETHCYLCCIARASGIQPVAAVPMHSLKGNAPTGLFSFFRLVGAGPVALRTGRCAGPCRPRRCPPRGRASGRRGTCRTGAIGASTRKCRALASGAGGGREVGGRVFGRWFWLRWLGGEAGVFFEKGWISWRVMV